MVVQTALSDAPAISPTAPPVIGGYRLDRLLGRGAMGEVWLGQHTVTRGLAAVKVMRHDALVNPRWRQFFARERQAVGRLSHPHVVRLYDVGEDYIATAYVRGTDLAQRLKSALGPPPPCASPPGGTAGHAHERRVIHRDVKPSNILLDDEDNAYLADFGIALLLDEPDEPTHRRQAGTPAYMAPEQQRGDALGPPADQYALARTLLVMLVGGGIPQDPLDALHHLPANLPPSLHQALRRALSVDPGERFASIGQFADALATLDLSAFPAPKLAPLLMDPAPFNWAAGAVRSEAIGPDIMRADYRLSHLQAQGLLPAAACEAFRRLTGYADFGWSLFGRTQRLGNLTHPSALVRSRSWWWAFTARCALAKSGATLPSPVPRQCAGRGDCSRSQRLRRFAFAHRDLR
jgi:serine/threonine-protein kinase